VGESAIDWRGELVALKAEACERRTLRLRIGASLLIRHISRARVRRSFCLLAMRTTVCGAHSQASHLCSGRPTC